MSEQKSEKKMEYVRDHSNDLNYKYQDYNNYNSWSNKIIGNIKISSIDEYNNIQTNNFKNNKLEILKSPYQTFVDVNLAWVKNEKN